MVPATHSSHDVCRAAFPGKLAAIQSLKSLPCSVAYLQELLTGGDLQALLDSQSILSEEEAKVAMRGVLSALAACHEKEICYGDVKPSNFMLANMYPCIAHILDPSKPKGDMQLRLIDFGCAQICPEGCSMLQGLSGTPGRNSCLSCTCPAAACSRVGCRTVINSR